MIRGRSTFVLSQASTRRDPGTTLTIYPVDRGRPALPLLIAAPNATRGPQWWYMSVLILIMIVPVIAMAIALERYIARGLLVGAVKG